MASCLNPKSIYFIHKSVSPEEFIHFSSAATNRISDFDKNEILDTRVEFLPSKSVDEFEKTNSVNSSQLSGVRSWLQSSGNGKKEQDMP